MSDKPQDTPVSSPPAASPSTAPQSHQEDEEKLRTAVDDLHHHLVGLIDESKVEERKDDSSESPLPLALLIADCCVMIQKQKAFKHRHLEGTSKNTTELVAKNERYILELQLLAKSLEKASPGYKAPKESDGLVTVFKAVRAHLKKSSTRESDMQEKICHLEGQCRINEEVLARMKQHDKLFVQLRSVEQRLTNVMPGFVSTESNETPSIVNYIQEHIAESQNKQSTLSADLLIREEEKKKSDEALRTTKTKLEQAKQSTRRAEQDLEKCKAELEQVKLEASSAKAAESSLANNLGKLLDRTKEVLLRIEFPREVISMEIPDKVGWLAGEHERTCIELIVMKQDLEQANSKIDKCSTDLKAAELKVQRLAAVDDVVSLIEFPKEIHPEQTLDKVRWLACDYKRTREELGVTKLNLERAKGELDKYSTELKAAEIELRELDVTRLNLERAKGELDKYSTELKAAEIELRELDTTRLNLERAKGELDKCSTELKAAEIELRELDVTRLNLERAKGELDKCSTDLKAAEIELRELDAMTLNLERAKGELHKCSTDLKAAELKVERLVCKVKAAGVDDSSQKIADGLSETIRAPEDEANEEHSDMETTRTGLAENYNIPKDSETSLAGKVLDEAKKEISCSDFPQEVVSMQEYKRTCKELGKTELRLQQTKDELDKCSTDLKAAELKAEGLRAIEDAISLIEFPMEIHAEQSLDKVRWLAGDYRKTCEELGATKLNFEQAKRELDTRDADLRAAELRVGRLLSKMKANIQGCMTVKDSSQKFVDKLSETIRTLEKEVKEEDSNTGTSGTELAQQQPQQPPACDQTQFQARTDVPQSDNRASASQSFHDGSNRGYPTYYSPVPQFGAAHAYMQQQVQLHALGSGIAPYAFHHVSAYAYPHPHPNTQWGVILMGYGSPAQQFWNGYYDASGPMRTYPASASRQDLYDWQTDEDHRRS